MTHPAKRIIINADGYGITAGLNRGIEESIENGVVTSISVNANFDTVWHLKELVARHPTISVGVHVNPVVGRPIADPKDVSTLVNDRGEFHFDRFTAKLQAGEIDLVELHHELTLQIRRVQELAGKAVTHIDSHQNRHMWPRFFKIFIDVAKVHGIARMRTHDLRINMEYSHRIPVTIAFYVTHPRRLGIHGYARYLMFRARQQGMRMCDRMLSVGHWGQHARKSMLDVWLQVGQSCPPGTNEIYCHPGYVDDDLRRWAKQIVQQREHELRVLTDPRLREAFDRNGVQRISFHDV